MKTAADLAGLSAPRRLSHLDRCGRARMVDVGEKPLSPREAQAEAFVSMSAEALARVEADNAPKGSVLGTAQLAGIAGAKICSSIIPLCHPLPLDHVQVNATLDAGGVRVTARVRCRAATGPDMEALTAAAAAALTVYDMVKGVDRSTVIGPVRLLSKRGGKTGEWAAGPGEPDAS